MDRPSFEQLIKEDRAARESKIWRGPFLEYLDLVREDPGIPKLAHARIFDNIMRSGTLDIQETDDPRVKRLYKDIVGPYWPPERRLVEQGYGSLEFPFDPVPTPLFALEKRWDLPALIGYLETWSALQRYRTAVGRDPLTLVREELEAAWGPPETVRTFRWDLDLRVGRKD